MCIRDSVVIDAAVICVSYFLAWVYKFVILRDPPGLGFVLYMVALAGIVPLYLMLYLAFNMYTAKRVQGRRLEIGNIVKANAFGLLIVMAVFFLLKMCIRDRYSDGTKVRDQFNTRIWDRLGAWDTPYDTRFGTSMKYVELVVNGEYRGLYGIFEPIDSTQLEISDQEYLYKRTYGRELLAETMDSVAPSEYLTVLGMELKGRNGQGNGEDWKCFRTFVEMCQSDDETFRAEAEKLLNMDNVADIWLYLQMMYAEDNIYKNMFFAFKKESDGYRM